MTDYVDPGWRRPLRLALWVHPLTVRASMRWNGGNQLALVRAYVLRIGAGLLLLLVAFGFFEPWDSGEEGWVPYAVVLVGFLSLAGIWRIRRRQLPIDSPEKLTANYRALVSVGTGFAANPTLFAFVGVLMAGSLWISLVGLAFTLPAVAWMAPTRADIERRQRELIQRGSSLSLGRALTGQPQADAAP